ncbi:MAG: cytochrome C [Gammaproteobacteria bacterium]|nr:cytochrome C [Gammaproteobacteria bacterium]
MKALWNRIWQRPVRWWMLGIPAGGFIMLVVGAIGLGTTNFIVHATSSTQFCFSCHSHEVNIRAEYEESSHFNNPSGMRVACSDCHLPKDNWFELMATKIIVSADIVPELMGKVDTPEKWEAHRAEMAEKVWAEYRANDSRYCRTCHQVEAMEGQSAIAVKLHQSLGENGKTCIDCHKGMAHALPRSP